MLGLVFCGCLGSILFFVGINDIFGFLNGNALLFEDDTTLLGQGKTPAAPRFRTIAV